MTEFQPQGHPAKGFEVQTKLGPRFQAAAVIASRIRSTAY
jgi:hypothetical protein